MATSPAQPALPRALPPALAARWRESTRFKQVLGAFLLSRSLVLVTAIYMSMRVPPINPSTDLPAVTKPFGEWPLGALLNHIFYSMARWDAVWYLVIAYDGYGDAKITGQFGGIMRAAFFPLYPAVVRLVSGMGASPGAVMIAAYAVSLAAFLGALYLFYRLVEVELGVTLARPAVLLLAFFPASLFFGAPFSESLFLLVTVGAFYAARTGHWAWAGALAAAASATRNSGIVLLLPLALLYLYGPREQAPDRAPAGGWRRLLPRYRLRLNVLWLGLAPLGLAFFSAWLQRSFGEPLAWVNQANELYMRERGFPFHGVWEALVSAWDGIRGLFAVDTPPHEFSLTAHNLMDLSFLAFAAVATVGVFRRLPLAYGAYVVVALMLPLTAPSLIEGVPLKALPRYVSVLFPLFMWLAIVCERRRVTDRVLLASAVLLGLFTAQIAQWHWFA